MTIDELLPLLEELKRLSPRRGETELCLSGPDGIYAILGFTHTIDYDGPEPEPIGVFEAESDAFAMGIDPDVVANHPRHAR
jgi:hypothetical protein